MATNQFSDKVRIKDDVALAFGDDDDINFAYDETTDNRLEITDASGNVLGYITDNGTTGILGVTGYLTAGEVLIGSATTSGSNRFKIKASGYTGGNDGLQILHNASGANDFGGVFIQNGNNALQLASNGNVSVYNDLNITGSLKLATVAVTATAAELNILDGVTATATELNHLDNCDRLEKVIKVALTASDADAGVFAWQNTEESSDIIVTRVIIDVTTAASAACEINIGQAATATASDNLIDGIDVNTATGVFDNIDDQGTNGNSKIRVTDDHYVTATVSSGASAGLVGNAYIHYIVI